METSGVLIINKAPGMTSHDVVNRVRRLYGTRQVGHTGTLDPMASGVLAVLVGRAVKASEYLLCADKRYIAGMKLGISTDTEDITGTVTAESANIPPREKVKEVIASFCGDIMQIPPMYSALKRDGKKLADLARKGLTIKLEPRPVTIYELEGIPVARSQTDYSLRVHCSKGTYIRSLCRDIGNALGCGAVMSSLERTQSGSFSISDAHTLEEIEKMTDTERAALVTDVEQLFGDLPAVTLPPFFARLAYSGCEIYLKKLGLEGKLKLSQRVRLCGSDGFFGLGEVGEYPSGKAVKMIKLLKMKP